MLFHVGDQHAELRAPVADMIEAQHIAAEKFEQPRQALADNRRANMAHMQLLGDIGRRKIDRPPLKDGKAKKRRDADRPKYAQFHGKGKQEKE